MSEGWNDIFLDLDPERGISAGERWERALHEAARRCEAVIFLLSKGWLSSRWCLNELNLARRLNKKLFGVLIEEDLKTQDLPPDVTSTWQVVRLAAGRDHVMFRVKLHVSGDERHVTFSSEGLTRLRLGLHKAGLHAGFFPWPPPDDLKRAPYRGLRPLEAEDAGIYFGREAPIVEAIDKLRGLADSAPPRILVVLGASGAGKSSFLRAGLLPRLARDDATFLTLPVIRPERAVVTGDAGVLQSLEGAFENAGLKKSRAEVRAAFQSGPAEVIELLRSVAGSVASATTDAPPHREAPALVVAVDQAEELFIADAQLEASKFLSVLREVLLGSDPRVIAVFTIRSDNYERLQNAGELAGLPQDTFSLPIMPKGSYAEVIRGPLRRLDGSSRSLSIDDALVDQLLGDVEAGSGKDALPLLAFTLQRLFSEYHATGRLTVAQYEALGRLGGSIEAAVERALSAANNDSEIPSGRGERLRLLRRGLIPWLAVIDPVTGSPRRRVARLSEIPAESRALIELLVEQRLLSTDVSEETGEVIVEPAHEALLRQWRLLQDWLEEDAGSLTVLDGIKRAARDWSENAKGDAWLAHKAARLQATEQLLLRTEFSAGLMPLEKEYLSACRSAEVAAASRERANARNRQRMQTYLVTLLAGVIVGLIGWINQAALKDRIHWFTTVRPYVVENVLPHVLAAEQAQSLRPKDIFRECPKACPEMVVLPAGNFMMGSPASEGSDDEHPQHRVDIPHPFAVSKYEITFDEWDECVKLGGCPDVSDSGYGLGARPVINVNWHEAQMYSEWLSRITGRSYRLLSESEWEYAARAGTSTAYSFGNDIDHICDFANSADISGKTSYPEWNIVHCDDHYVTTAPFGSFKPNAFGLYDMHGNVWEWVEDCWAPSYRGAPSDGSPVTHDRCLNRVYRGGSWYSHSKYLRSAKRLKYQPDQRSHVLGFRVARSL